MAAVEQTLVGVVIKRKLSLAKCVQLDFKGMSINCSCKFGWTANNNKSQANTEFFPTISHSRSSSSPINVCDTQYTLYTYDIY